MPEERGATKPTSNLHLDCAFGGKSVWMGFPWKELIQPLRFIEVRSLSEAKEADSPPVNTQETFFSNQSPEALDLRYHTT